MARDSLRSSSGATSQVMSLGVRAMKGLSPWTRWFLAAVVAGLLVYMVQLATAEIDASNAWGIAYGIAATALMLGVALLGVRRRAMRWGPGRSRTWQQFHLYGGGLFFLLVLMHMGFALPKGAMTWWLFILSLWVFASGLLGVAVQTWVPRALSSGLRVEALYERIPGLVDHLRQRAGDLAAAGPPPVADFYRRSLEEIMRRPLPRAAYLFDVSAGSRGVHDKFRFLREVVSSEDRPLVEELEEVCTTKLELDAHYTLQRGFRYWMALHLPPSIALLVLVVLHIFTILYW